MLKKFLVYLFIIFLAKSFAQELNCKVTVNYEGLQIRNRELLADFASVIENYLNSTQFNNEPWEGDKIDCNFNIFFTGASSDVEYTAQVVIVSTRPVYKSDRQSPMLTINDPNWSFRYEKGQALYSNQAVYDPITSFLDFYANIIIGWDWDSWSELGGNANFQKAFSIANLGMNSNYRKGWERGSEAYNRTRFCDDLLNEKFRPFREAFYEYHYGIDYFQVDKRQAQNHIVNLINVLFEMRSKIDINSVLIRTFFDAKYGEIVDLLKDYPDKTIVDKLKRIDPSHISKYNELLK
ncbi:MAG: DUF4835 family protein [Ignavibacterium sp.]|nr:DUF4835 family protein [Ignavibacterium sp.]MCX7611525.1 DUF4835 family protein [Ignavibacterium sp.]MDW8375820.1 DUF4835 family protein [Ignavibacteriales bacterium]